MIRKLFLGGAVAAVAALALLLTVGSSNASKPQPAEAVVASISTTTSVINNAFWAQLHIVAEDDFFGNPNTSDYDLRVTATAGDFGGIDGCAIVFLDYAQTGCAPVLIPPLPACYYDEFLATPCVILETNGFPILTAFFPTLLGPADRDVTICNTGESTADPTTGDWFVDCSAFGIAPNEEGVPIDLSPFPEADTTEVELWWQSPNGVPGTTVSFSAWQGTSVKTTSITVLGAPDSIDLVALREVSQEGSLCAGTEVKVIAAVEYDHFGPGETFNNDRAILCADVRDSNDSPLPDVAIDWAVTGGGCVGVPTTTFTNDAFTSPGGTPPAIVAGGHTGLAYNTLSSCGSGNAGDIAHVTASSGSASGSVDVEFGGTPAGCVLTITPDPLDVGDPGAAGVVFEDAEGNKVPDGIKVHFVEVDSGDGADNAQLVSTIEDTVDSMAGTSFIAAIAGLTTISASIETVAAVDPTCAEAIELSGDIHVTPTDCDDPDMILFGNPPPAGGGFGTFAFCGGTWEQLLDASNCPEATAVFFYNTPQGDFEVWIPGSDVAAVNEEILDRWPNEHNPIPEGTIFTAKCV